MKITILLLLSAFSLFATSKPEVYTTSMTIDDIYDDYEGEELILKLIEDKKIDEARIYYENDVTKSNLEKYYDSFFKGVFHVHQNKTNQALDLFISSLNIKFSLPAFIHTADLITKEKRNFCNINKLNLTDHADEILKLNSLQQNIFTAWLKHCESLSEFKELYSFIDDLNAKKFQIDLFFIKTNYLLKNGLSFVAFQQTKNLFIDETNLKIHQVLNLIELFKSHQHLTESETLLEIAKLKFGPKDEILLLLAQLNLVKENYFLANHYLQQLQNKSSVVYIVLSELVTKTNHASLVSFYRLFIEDPKEYLKSQLIYLIQNEKWIQVYSQYENVKKTSLQNKEIFYALSYSSGLVKDAAHEDLFLNLSK